MAGARKVAYAFGTEQDLDNAILAGRLAIGSNTTGGRVLSESLRGPIFAKVDTGESGFDVTATQVVWDSSLNSGDGDWAAPTGTAWRWNTTAFNNGDSYTTKNLRSTTSLSADDVVEVMLYGDKSETTQSLARPGGGGGSLVYATSPNTTFDASFTYGATVPFPGDTSSNSTALELGASFYLSTPWNTRVSAPDKLFAWWNKIGDDYYLPVETFYVKPTVTYPTSGGIGTFTCYYNDKATHSLGTNTAFPSGVTAVLDGFTNASASSDVRGYFNGKIFPASYDSENNIIYMSHPRF